LTKEAHPGSAGLKAEFCAEALPAGAFSLQVIHKFYRSAIWLIRIAPSVRENPRSKFVELLESGSQVTSEIVEGEKVI
jgi:hypothetical protein